MQAMVWTLATAAAMAGTWYGVRTVLAGTAYEPPRALPISGTTTPPAAEPAPSQASPSQVASPTPTPGNTQSPAAQPSPDTSRVKSYPVRGGRTVFDLGESSATLVSATPEEGWQMRVWKQSAWIRVDFVAGTRTTSVFVTWNGHPPQVQTVEN